MKPIFQYFLNIALYFANVTVNFFLLVFWYGKLPKVSVYHQQAFDIPLNKIFEDDLIQSKYGVSKEMRKKIIYDYLQMLNKNQEFTANTNSLDIPIFDGKDIIGSKTLYSVMDDQVKNIEKDFTPYKD